MDRIAEFLKITGEEAKKFFVASPGALLNDNGVTRRVGTITPKRVKSRCIFLDENDRCKIHPVAPTACAYFDTHMSRSMAMHRSVELVRRQESAGYQALRNQLPYSQHYKPKAY